MIDVSALYLLWPVISLILPQNVSCLALQRQMDYPTDPMSENQKDDTIQSFNGHKGQDLSNPANGMQSDYIDYIDDSELNENKQNLLRQLENGIREESEIITKSTLLMEMLEDPNIDTLPIVYVENAPSEEHAEVEVDKRSPYTRKYTWKRHTSKHKGNYELESLYLCVPTKDDIFKLLVGLHENKKGNHQKTIRFCNRKLPAKSIFTNIRFLG